MLHCEKIVGDHDEYYVDEDEDDYRVDEDNDDNHDKIDKSDNSSDKCCIVRN